MKIEHPEGDDALKEFILFQDRVYDYRAARWPADVEFLLAILKEQSPFAQRRIFRPVVVREHGEILARALAMMDAGYNEYWHQRLGHVVYFEALPNTRQAVKLMMDDACEWLEQQGAEAARAGFGLLEFPFVLDDYESLPPSMCRFNPAYYHCLLKDAGFESEKGWVDFKIEVTPELIDRYKNATEGARRAGFEIVPVGQLPAAQRERDFMATFNETFKAHWGFTPFLPGQVPIFLDAGPDTSLLVYQSGLPVGVLLVTPEHTTDAVLKPGRRLDESEKLNILGIGVRESARGKGINIAMAGYSFLELVKQGAKYLSYTLVLDDNWPSRRTAEKLGAFACATIGCTGGTSETDQSQAVLGLAQSPRTPHFARRR